MADKCHLCLLGLIFLSSLLTGTSGVDESHHVFISSGTQNKDIKSHKGLSLGSDCSLNINNVTKEYYGLYSCQQWTGVDGQHQKQANDTFVYLHVLDVSPSSSQTEISPGSSVTLSCEMYSYSLYTGVSCDDWIRSEGIQLFWVNQAGVKLTISDSRYQTPAPGHCIITLTTTLLNEDDNREWRCNVTHRDQLKTSATYTVKSSGKMIYVSVAAAAFVVFLLAVLCLIWRKKRAGNKRETGGSSVKAENEDKVTYETINMSNPAAARDNEQTDDVTYSEVTSSSKKPVKALTDHDDAVTYAAIKGKDNEKQNELYASVNKNKSSTNKQK
ncbi:uncharacterized protein [Garra rufa]|uniref:uncharacterized protein n=1 Tax=Garra rufa TaxID=137080 RepID=UPI003CCEAFE6